MWYYSQKTGTLKQDGLIEGVGYSGKGQGKNNPDMEMIPNVGPIPKGLYEIGTPRDTAKHGPFVMSLTPSISNEMFSRSEFLIHGDSIDSPGNASEGCIILGKVLRHLIADSLDNQLTVL